MADVLFPMFLVVLEEKCSKVSVLGILDNSYIMGIYGVSMKLKVSNQLGCMGCPLLGVPPEPQHIGKKHSVSRLFYLFVRLDLFSSAFLFLTLLTSAFPSVHIVGSLTSKLPSIHHDV